MKKLILILPFLFLTALVFSQHEQEGFLILLDKPDNQPGISGDTETYYISPLLKCQFPNELDALDAKRTALQQEFKEFVLENYDIPNFQNVNNDFMVRGRGVNPTRSYEKKLENLPIMRKGCTVIIVEDFQPNCND